MFLSKLKKDISTLLLVSGLYIGEAKSQTFFETAEGEGNIFFRQGTVSQFKVNLASTTITYGYYFAKGESTSPRKLIGLFEVKAEPNDDGVATLLKEGNFQPGLQLNGALGIRFNDNLPGKTFSILDIYFKPDFQLNSYTLYDITRLARGEAPKYTDTRVQFGGSLLINYLTSPGKTNLYAGVEAGIRSSNNADDLDDGSLQTLQPVPGAANQFLRNGIEEVKLGELKRTTAIPLKIDMVFDLGMKLNKNATTGIRLGLFGYYRSNLKVNKNRIGMGICLLNAKDPSKIFTSFGYEFAGFGSDIKDDTREKDKGIVFVSIGYSIFK